VTTIGFLAGVVIVPIAANAVIGIIGVIGKPGVGSMIARTGRTEI
jgi:hypothetical protein